jgi:nucleoside-diphosphate-sugar epimerase
MILVTGATGFVGSHLLLQLLESKERVCAIYRNSASISKTKALFQLYKKENLFKKITWVQADITDVPSLELAFKNVDYVYHCAALVSFDPKDEEVLRKVNIEGTANVVNFCLAYNVKKLCHVSSIAALGDLLPHESITDETKEWNPEKQHSDYAISKYGAEMEVWRGQQEGLDVVIVNPGVILGPGFWKEGSGKIVSQLSNGTMFYTKGSTGFVAVQDVASIMVQLMKENFKGERYVIVAENRIYRDVLDTFSNYFHTKKPSIYAKKRMTNMLYRMDWLLANLFFLKRRLPKTIAKSLHDKEVYANDKIKKELHFEFRSIDDCILETVIFYLIVRF